MPHIDGTRVQVSIILACLRDNMTIGEICEDYNLDKKDIIDAINYAIDVMDIPFV
jgi:uncharacterized protein (DUF433 family)